MDIVKFNQIGGFPLTTNIMNIVQQAYRLLNSLGYLAGDKIIITGCDKDTNNVVSDGIVFLDGEMYLFKGGAEQPKVLIKTESESKEFENGSVKEVVVRRYVTFGTGAGSINWSDFKRVKPLETLMSEISNIDTAISAITTALDTKITKNPNGATNKVFNERGELVTFGSYYEPTVVVDSFTPSVLDTNNTYDITITGKFLDYAEVSVDTPNQTGVVLNVVSKKFDELKLTLQTNLTRQVYTLKLKPPRGQEVILSLPTPAYTDTVPSLNGTGKSLWQKPTTNPAILSDGVFECPINNSAWNCYALCSLFKSAQRIEFSYTIERAGVCFVGFVNLIRGGDHNDALFYPVIHHGGGYVNVKVEGNQWNTYGQHYFPAGTKIKIIFSVNSFEYFINETRFVNILGGFGNSVVNGLHLVFKGYSSFKAKDIKIREY